MGIKVSGPDLATIEGFGLQLENILKQIPSIKTESVFADRIVGKPYLLIDLDREKLARYGLTINQVQQYLMVTIGGMELTQTIEGRERYPVRVRYPRELRDNPEVLKEILIPTSGGIEIRLGDLATINYEKGPQVIKSEDTFLIGYVLFDKLPQYAEVSVVETAQQFIQDKIEEGNLVVPAGVNYRFTGNYENQVRAEKRLAVVIPVVLVVIFLILYFQFKSARVSLMVFSGVVVAFAGGFILIWLYGKEGFMDFSILGSNFRDLFQMQSINLSIAVWVGFIALFGIATDGGVVMATYLNQVFTKNKPSSQEEIHNHVIEAGKIRIRPTLMTTATTILALLPVLSSTGRGSDIMVPMAIPSFGGMLVQVITLFMVPVFYSMMKENQLNRKEEAS
jgi:Cu(I)/Ag(I) efflux system membrane protein CusA/SilA